MPLHNAKCECEWAGEVFFQPKAGIESVECPNCKKCRMRQPDVVLDNGNIRLYCGDCLEILPTLEAGRVDAVVTYQPYACGKRWTGGTWFKNGVYEIDKAKWDTLAPQEAVESLLSIGKVQIVWGGNYFKLPPSRCWLAWEKNSMPTMADFELAWTNLDRPAKSMKRGRNGWKRQHPTEKPLDVMEWCVGFAGEGTILDPFMGSGTTGVACVKTGRKFIGIELDRGYFDIAVKRIEKALKERDEQLIGASNAAA